MAVASPEYFDEGVQDAQSLAAIERRDFSTSLAPRCDQPVAQQASLPSLRDGKCLGALRSQVPPPLLVCANPVGIILVGTPSASSQCRRRSRTVGGATRCGWSAIAVHDLKVRVELGG